MTLDQHKKDALMTLEMSSRTKSNLVQSELNQFMNKLKQMMAKDDLVICVYKDNKTLK
jgi:1,2-phenylacetyl-CoA epoxidase catalytic subunit